MVARSVDNATSPEKPPHSLCSPRTALNLAWEQESTHLSFNGRPIRCSSEAHHCYLDPFSAGGLVQCRTSRPEREAVSHHCFHLDTPRLNKLKSSLVVGTPGIRTASYLQFFVVDEVRLDLRPSFGGQASKDIDTSSLPSHVESIIHEPGYANADNDRIHPKPSCNLGHD